jgi:hypothetical protein
MRIFVGNWEVDNDGGAATTVHNRGLCIYVYNTTKVVKIANYNLINGWRHVSAALTAIFRPTCGKV